MKGIQDAVAKEEWKKDSGWIEKNGDWKLEDVSDVIKPTHSHLRTYVHTTETKCNYKGMPYITLKRIQGFSSVVVSL
jgi:hypothetical protein